MTSNRLTYDCLAPIQSDTVQVFSFVSTVDQIQRFAKIDRIGRTEKGELGGFQRPLIANHIEEIRRYLETKEAILPNAIIIAFTEGALFERSDNGLCRISIDVSNGPNGYIVDGQQRFMALSSIKTDKKFEVFVAGFICDSINELQKQFILINNTKPLPKALIYELLPKIDGLPQRMSSRSIASQLTEVLNYTDDSSLKGLIFQQTNPYGVIRDTAIQKVIMNSLSDGALRPMLRESDSLERAFRLISNFFEAVKEVFHEEWNGHTPKTSRLIHAAGIVSMGYVMETLYSMNGTTNTDDFLRGLEYLKGKTAWSEGYWEFDQEERRVWNSIQYVPRDVRQLAQYLISIVRRTATDIE